MCVTKDVIVRLVFEEGGNSVLLFFVLFCLFFLNINSNFNFKSLKVTTLPVLEHVVSRITRESEYLTKDF